MKSSLFACSVQFRPWVSEHQDAEEKLGLPEGLEIPLCHERIEVAFCRCQWSWRGEVHGTYRLQF